MGCLPYFLEKAAEKKRIPVDVHFGVNTVCNSKCVMCYLDDELKGPTTEQIKNVLDDLAAEGCLFLTVSGGEPFLRDDILEILDYATDKGFVVTLKTNGTLVTGEMVLRIAKMGIFDVHISLHGSTAKIQDAITRMPGSFEKTIRTIKLFVKAGVKTNIMTVLMHGHLDELEKIQKLSDEIGVNDVIFTPFIFTKVNGNKQSLNYRLLDDELRDYFRLMRKNPEQKQKMCGDELNSLLQLCERSKDARQSDDRIVDLNFDTSDPLAYLPEEDKDDDLQISCAVVRKSVTIRPNGDVVPCELIPFVLGNTFKNSIRDILNSPKADAAIEMIRLKNNEQCSSCSDKIGCFRCPGMAYLEHGDSRIAPSEGCRQMKIQKEVLSERGIK
jgi:radical SAM protein with 4Fe4S-binding SPASM domain